MSQDGQVVAVVAYLLQIDSADLLTSLDWINPYENRVNFSKTFMEDASSNTLAI